MELNCKLPALPRFEREATNPVLTADMWPYPVNSVFNPGATRLQDGRVLLLCRCEDFRGHSHLTKAISPDGVGNWEIDTQPTICPDLHGHPHELWGMEDCRITWMEDRQEYVIAYTAYSRRGPGVALMTTKDFEDFQRIGLIMRPDDKDAAVFPTKFNGKYALIHRTKTDDPVGMWLSYSLDSKHWGESERWLQPRMGAWWDANKIGLCCPPIETERGWLVLYHGVRTHASGSLYRCGAALFDKENLKLPLARGDEYIFGPKEPYEMVGDVGSVVFPCGFVVAPDNDTLMMYYGAADTSIGLVRASINEITTWLLESPKTYQQELSLSYLDDTLH